MVGHHRNDHNQALAMRKKTRSNHRRVAGMKTPPCWRAEPNHLGILSNILLLLGELHHVCVILFLRERPSLLVIKIKKNRCRQIDYFLSPTPSPTTLEKGYLIW